MRKTKYQIIDQQAKAVESWPDDKPEEAMAFEDMGWSMSLELAPRCNNKNCDICHH